MKFMVTVPAGHVLIFNASETAVAGLAHGILAARDVSEDGVITMFDRGEIIPRVISDSEVKAALEAGRERDADPGDPGADA